MFRFFETRIDVTGEPEVLTPPNTLPAFYWHFVRQAKGVVFMQFLQRAYPGATW